MLAELCSCVYWFLARQKEVCHSRFRRSSFVKVISVAKYEYMGKFLNAHFFLLFGFIYLKKTL